MSRYIDEDDVRAAVTAWDMQDLYLPIHFLDLLEDVPTADVQEVKRGEWIPISDGEWAECSECGDGCGVSENGGMAAFSLFQKFYKYCPNCGARMDGKECENDE